MTYSITGLHHVTSIAADARRVDRYLTGALGLRRVKKTVNFDAPEVYHLYYGDEVGRPGGVMTYFPFTGAAPGRRGSGEVATTVFAIPDGAARDWAERLATGAARDVAVAKDAFGATRVSFTAPEGDGFALVEDRADARQPWTAEMDASTAIRGFHSVVLRLAEAGPTEDVLHLMGYETVERRGSTRRLAIPGGTANVIDIDTAPDAGPARQGAGSVHHVAFAVADRAAQDAVRARLLDAGMDVTPAIDRDYFWAIYFRTPGGVLFEIATAEPGFDRDEPVETLGQALKLPRQHEHLRPSLESRLPDLDA